MKKQTWTALLCMNLFLIACGGGDQEEVTTQTALVHPLDVPESSRQEEVNSSISESILDSTSTRSGLPNSVRQASISELYVSGEATRRNDQPLYALQGGVHRFSGFLLKQSAAQSDLVATLRAPNGRAILKPIDNGWDLYLDSNGLPAGSVIPIIVSVSSTTQKAQVDIARRVMVLQTNSVTTDVENSGRSVVLDGLRFNFSSHSRSQKPVVTIRHAAVPNHGDLLQVDVLPPNTHSEIRYTVGRNTPNSSNTGDTCQQGAIPSQTLLEELESSQPYSDPSEPEVLKSSWLCGEGIYKSYGDLRLPRPPTNFPYTIDKSWELNSLIFSGRTVDEWRGFRPVLFINGYAIHEEHFYAYPYLGGGPGTWDGFPNLVKRHTDRDGNRLVPFEYRWNTDTSFFLQSKDLAAAIRKIYSETGQKVAIVAHSFGGLLARSVLQSQAGSENVDVVGMVSAMLTLGTPNSGISQTATIRHGVALPPGQDAFYFVGCKQVSCHVQGQPALEPSDIALVEVSAEPGGEAAALFRSASFLPPINILVGIGDVQTHVIFDTWNYGDGDNLISYWGQRFLPNDFFNKRKLRNWERIDGSGAVVLEQALGLKRGVDIKTGKVASIEDLFPGDTRARQYSHTPPLPIFWDKQTEGAEANIPLDGIGCDIVATCLHGSWRLFAELMDRQTPSTKSISKLNDTGVTKSQCFALGQTALVGCNTTEAIALSGAQKQDGMIESQFVFSEVRNLRGKRFPTTECVFDNRTGLMWEGKPIDGSFRDASHTYTNWRENLISMDSARYVQLVNEAELCGYKDWRLPSVTELQTILKLNVVPPEKSINTAWFPNTQDEYWADNYRPQNWEYESFYVNFSDGTISFGHNGTFRHVRLVRSGTVGMDLRWLDAGDAVFDRETNLYWKRCTEGVVWTAGACIGEPLYLTQDQAFERARGSNGWRLPNAKELGSIMYRFHSYFYNAPFTNPFPGAWKPIVWTSSPYMYDTNESWSADFTTGGMTGLLRNSSELVWLVKDAR